MKCCVATHVKERNYLSRTHNFFQSSGGSFVLGIGSHGDYFCHVNSLFLTNLIYFGPEWATLAARIFIGLCSRIGSVYSVYVIWKYVLFYCQLYCLVTGDYFCHVNFLFLTNLIYFGLEWATLAARIFIWILLSHHWHSEGNNFVFGTCFVADPALKSGVWQERPPNLLTAPAKGPSVLAINFAFLNQWAFISPLYLSPRAFLLSNLMFCNLS